jgi:hypothetical protein
MPFFRRERRPPPAPRARLQPWQLHASAGDAEGSGTVVADQPAREADQDRRRGRYVTFQMAEVAVSQQMFAEILSLTLGSGHHPRPHEEATESNVA